MSRDYIKTFGTIAPPNTEVEVTVTGTDFSGNKRALDVSIAGGTVGPSGLLTGGLITEVPLNDSTWTPLPATPLVNRNAVAIQNKSANQIKINYDPLTVGYVGMVIEADEERFYSIKDTIIIYAKSATGTTPTVYIEEIA